MAEKNPKGQPPSDDDADTSVSGHSAGGGGKRPNSSDVFFAPRPPPEPEPERIGKYRIVKRIGSGGMGLVYMGVREDDKFQNRVAIKVIKKGMDSEEIKHRFEQERQVLTALNHPNIARLLDGGTTDDGRPYFVMEFIEGMPIDEYCDKGRLRIEERLELFRTLCTAVHHAHQNLVVHRDLKPSNVVVTQNGTVKLLDFGIAKLLNPALAAFVSEPTATALRLMTPEYASPEQVRGDPLSTASDIYSLGVMLYELVTGRRPYRFKTRLQSEIERIICNEDPERPSTAISRVPEGTAQPPSADSTGKGPNTGSSIEDIAKVRDAKPDRLRRSLSGDIDNMILLAMRKEPQRRYKSAEQFAEDIKRHLTGMPVIARPATWTYRLDKFVHRNKYGVAAAAAIALTLVVGMVATYSQMVRANTYAMHAENNAIEARKQEQAAKEAKLQSDKVRQVTSTSLGALSDDLKKLPSTNDARKILIENTLNFIKNLSGAVGQDLALNKELIDWKMRLGDLQGGLRNSNLGETDPALTTYREALGMIGALRIQSSNDADLIRHECNAHIKIGDMLARQRTFDKALIEYESAQRLIEPLSGPSDLLSRRAWTTAMIGRADTLRSMNQEPDQARRLYQVALPIKEELVRLQTGDVTAQRDLTKIQGRFADMLFRDGKYDESLAIYATIRTKRQKLSDDEPTNSRLKRDLAWADYYIGQNWQSKGDIAKAGASLDSARSIMKDSYDLEPKGGEAIKDYAVMLLALGDWASAQRIAALDHTDTVRAEQFTTQAMTSYLQCHELLKPFVEKQDTTDAYAKELLAGLLKNWGVLDEKIGRKEEARQHLSDAKKIYGELSPNGDRYVAEVAYINESLDRAR